MNDLLKKGYRVATTQEIRDESFGQLKATQRDVSGNSWLTNSLLDEAIFGPKKSYRCGCGKYSDRESFATAKDILVCEDCGVLFASCKVRRERFGHVELKTPVQHPLDSSVEMQCFPVLPAVFFSSINGVHLKPFYEKLIEEKSREEINKCVEELVNRIGEVAEIAFKWNLLEADILIKAVALRDSKENQSGQESKLPGLFD